MQLQLEKCGVNIFIQFMQIFLSFVLFFFPHILQGLFIFICENKISISIIIIFKLYKLYIING
jgi:hypothetical protein